MRDLIKMLTDLGAVFAVRDGFCLVATDRGYVPCFDVIDAFRVAGRLSGVTS